MVSSQIMQAHVSPKGAEERLLQGLRCFGAKGKEVFTGGYVWDWLHWQNSLLCACSRLARLLALLRPAFSC